MSAALIHLDTNFLIVASTQDSDARGRVNRWIEEGTAIAISAMAWAEFRCGPVDTDIVESWERALGSVIVPVDRSIAECAAELFNASGWRGRSLPDCLIAACAIKAGAHLATLNRADFEPLQALGLALA